ncbi:MAG: hypothetical protein K0M56_10345 [Kaistella sp.]|nr:hypothetical protein [Kaistella sp.]
MKYLFLFVCLIVFSCGKNNKTETSSFNQEKTVIQYDTVAVDSFSAGAVSVDIAQKIRASSQKYEDSLLQIHQKEEADKLQKELSTKEKETKKLAEEKEKAEETKSKEKNSATAETKTAEANKNP